MGVDTSSHYGCSILMMDLVIFVEDRMMKCTMGCKERNIVKDIQDENLYCHLGGCWSNTHVHYKIEIHINTKC